MHILDASLNLPAPTLILHKFHLSLVSTWSEMIQGVQLHILWINSFFIFEVVTMIELTLECFWILWIVEVTVILYLVCSQQIFLHICSFYPAIILFLLFSKNSEAWRTSFHHFSLPGDTGTRAQNSILPKTWIFQDTRRVRSRHREAKISSCSHSLPAQVSLVCSSHRRCASIRVKSGVSETLVSFASYTHLYFVPTRIEQLKRENYFPFCCARCALLVVNKQAMRNVTRWSLRLFK